ncbi:thioester-containing protein 1 allele S1-like [Macrobrachium nipponense]|uniref:thioester-containing protein 1 allele S1-like n=1 Tax=Macrobrachium nipponense TaxID=159736 RepID=UPI0030C85791
MLSLPRTTAILLLVAICFSRGAESRRGWKHVFLRKDPQDVANIGEVPEATKIHRDLFHTLAPHQKAGMSLPYVILAPTIARPDSVYQLVVGILRGKAPVEVRASLATVNTGVEVAQARVVIEPGNLAPLKMKIPVDISSLSRGSSFSRESHRNEWTSAETEAPAWSESSSTSSYLKEDTGPGLTLRVEGREGSSTVFKNTSFVSVSPRFITVLVEMSRPMYDGGQTVEFRVILLKLDRTPYHGPVDVYVMDPHGYVIRRWVSVYPTIGVIELSMGSVVIPKRGWYRVRVVTAGQVDEHPFFLTKYFVTKFETHIDLPYFVLSSEESVRGSFNALFLTYKPVPGNATITYNLKEKDDKKFREVASQVVPYAEGPYEFQLPFETLRKSAKDSDLGDAEVKVRVAFFHPFQIHTIKAFATTRIINPDVKLEFLGASPIVFKPGMSLKSAVSVRYRDLEPLEEERLGASSLTITPSVTLKSGSVKDLTKVVVRPRKEVKHWRDLLKEGVLSANATQEVTAHLMESFVHHNAFDRYRSLGILEFNIDIPKDAVSLLLSATYEDPTGSASEVAKGIPVYSPGGRYLHLTSSTDRVRVGEFSVFHVRANFHMTKFQYMVMSKGILVYTATEEVTWAGIEGITTVSVAVAREMSPLFTLVVAHVTADGEFIADTIHVSVDVENDVKADALLNQDKDHSKRTVELGIWAAAGSFLGVNCARVSNYRLQAPNRVFHSRLMKAALSMEPNLRSVPVVRHRSRGGHWPERLTTLSSENGATWALPALHNSGLTVASNTQSAHPLGTGKCDGTAGFLECGDGSCYRQLEVCDGYKHCLNGFDEINCLVVHREAEDLDSSGPVFRSPEILDEESRLLHRNFLRDTFDRAEGGWCYTTKYIGHRGYEMLKLKVPNTPAKWVLSSYVIHPEYGLSVLPDLNHDSTPPLLMRLECTSFCRRGEQVSVRVHLQNPTRFAQMVMLILEGNPDYMFVNVDEGAQVQHYNPRLTPGEHHHLITIKAGEHKEVMLPLAIVKQSGMVTITVHTLAQVGMNTQQVRVEVVPEGALVRKHTSVLLDLKNRATVYEFLDLPVDESPEISRSLLRRYVYGSPRARVAISGDVFGPIPKDLVLTGIRSFNGLDLKSNDGYAFDFGSTLWALHYLRLTNQLNISEAQVAFDHLNVQMATLLLRRDGGGFKMWGAARKSVWMTSWILSLLLSAQLEEWENLIFVDPKIIREGVAFLVENQRRDGSFAELALNATHDYKMSFKGQISREEGHGVGEGEEPTLVALTALVTTVLHEALGGSIEGSLHRRAVNARLRATHFLERQVDALWDPYDLAITTYALHVVGSPEKEVAVKKLESYAKVTGSMTHWSRAAIASNQRLRENSQRTFLLPKEPQEWDSYAVEATSYALLVFLKREGVTAKTESIMEWLVSVRNWDHAYSSTIDTVMAYRAVSEYSYRARLRSITNVRVQLEATSTPGSRKHLFISNHSLTAMNSVPIARPWGHVYLMAEGSGQAIAQLETSWGVDLAQYLLKPPRTYFSLMVKEDYLSPRNKTHIRVSVCTRWLATDISPDSHAALLEVDNPSGYFFEIQMANDHASLVRRTKLPQLMNAKSTPKKMFYQFHHIPGDKKVCFDYITERRFPVANHTAVRSATIFEQFAPEHFQTTVINATPLAVLDICEVCGSYQCPYCPSYSSAPAERTSWIHVSIPIFGTTLLVKLSLFP